MIDRYENIKWAAIQPLTGGAYLGTESVIGHPAEFILSFNGLTDTVYDKNNNVRYYQNEYHLVKYLEKRKNMPPYYTFSHSMFDMPNDVIISDDKFFQKHTDIDLIIAVPVCSGLSAANTADHGKKDSIKNNNLKFITEFTLSKIKPKAFIFENAPGLYTSKGFVVRHQLNDYAEKYGYSITYIKTDTKLHHNVQRRPRTFVIFWKSNKPLVVNSQQAKIDSVEDFLLLIPKHATQNTEKDVANFINEKNNIELSFLKQKFGSEWREKVGSIRLKSFILMNNLEEEFYQFHKNDDLKKHYDYCRMKRNNHKGHYDRTFFVCPKDHAPTVYHGNTWSMLHPTKDRCLTMREYMHLMGMPNDFEFQGDYESFGSQIGQNVPAKTMAHWIEEICKNLVFWNESKKIHPQRQPKMLENDYNERVYFFNNVHLNQSCYG